MTTFLAWWGAILASIALIWNYMRGRRDKGIVRILARIGILIDYGPAKALIVTVANTGRRPITLTHWRGLLKKGNPREFTSSLWEAPGKLEESQEHTDYTHDLSVLTDNLAALYVFDTTGKKWKVKKKILRRLVEDAKPNVHISPNTFHFGPE